jgi:probable phosphoglycerate mutase
MTTILIARHGNNFEPGDTVLRVGAHTDLPLSSSGREQAKNLGNFLKTNKIHPSAVFTSNLIRTKETAEIALQAAGLNITPEAKAIFNEIDYGPDEGKPEEEVIARIGKPALDEWESAAFVPPDWKVDVDQIIQNWRDFAAEVLSKYAGQTVLVITSNGIARFAPYLTHNFFSFSQTHKIKLSTGALGSLSYSGDNWKIDYWNEKPQSTEEISAHDEEFGENDIDNEEISEL